MQIAVQVHGQARRGEWPQPRYRRIFDLPSVPRKGERVKVDGLGPAAVMLEVVEVWWREGLPPLVLLLGSVPPGVELPNEWTLLAEDED